jgi:YD repeat-containing protein
MYLTLDGMGNVLEQEVRGPNGELSARVTRLFDALSRLQGEQGALATSGTKLQYDPNGNLTALIDQMGRTTIRQYDNFNRTTRIHLPTPGPTSTSHIVSYSYNHQDLLTSVSDPRLLKTSYTFNGFGKRTAISSPDTGTRKSVFDGAGNLESIRDSRGVVTTYAYDAAQRLIRRGSTSYEYGAPATAASGRLKEMRDDSGQTSYTYDSFGRILAKRSVSSLGQLRGTSA